MYWLSLCLKVGRREAAAERLGLNKRKKKKEKLDIEEVRRVSH